MVNQAREQVTEEQDVRAARFVEDYLNAVENLPDAVQRHFSRMLDIDINYRKHVCQVEYFHGVLADTQLDPGSRRQTLGKMNNSLIIMQDLGDEKLKILQTVHDLIEQQLRQLDVDFKNIRPKVEQENNEPLDTSSGSNSVISSTNKIESVNMIKTINNEKVVRRGRRTRNETLAAEEAEKTTDAINILSENQSSNLPGTSNGTTKRTSTGSGNGSGRRKKRKSQNNQNQSRGETPPPKNDDSDDEVDPDEPLYCICNKVSYGKMILCDNDGCEQEWFHFDCMFLTAKPKGKWYCPQCRGSKPNLPKSRSQIR